MRRDFINFYQVARNNAGLTQEHASELLHISIRTLSDYENNKYKVPDEIVVAMTEKYNASWLPLMHLKNISPGVNLEELCLKELSGSTISFQSSLGHIQDVLRHLIDVVSDEVIDEKEVYTVKIIQEKLFDLLIATLNLIVSLQEKSPSRAGTHKRA